MNKKKRIAILFVVIIVVAVGIIIAVASHQKKEMDFDKFADRFEKSAEEVLGEDVKKVSKTELAVTLTYGDQNDKDNNIYYRILKTTFYEGDPAEITGLHTEALGALFPVDSMYMVIFNFISYNGLALGTSAFCISKVFSTIFHLISWKGIFISKNGPFSAND